MKVVARNLLEAVLEIEPFGGVVERMNENGSDADLVCGGEATLQSVKQEPGPQPLPLLHRVHRQSCEDDYRDRVGWHSPHGSLSSLLLFDRPCRKRIVTHDPAVMT